jgi:hypothetical protein
MLRRIGPFLRQNDSKNAAAGTWADFLRRIFQVVDGLACINNLKSGCPQQLLDLSSRTEIGCGI